MIYLDKSFNECYSTVKMSYLKFLINANVMHIHVHTCKCHEIAWNYDVVVFCYVHIRNCMMLGI